MAVTITRKAKPIKKPAVRKKAAGYNSFKTYRGQQYTGMHVGGTHKWYYDKGEWHDRKITPDKWDIRYSVTKRRAGKAPEGTGVPVGTGYHWFILAHQFVHKLNADDYSTDMVGIKLKLAHKRADKGKWNISETTQRKHLVQMLKDFIRELEDEPVKFETIPLQFQFKSKAYEGYAIPMMGSCRNGVCNELDIILNDKDVGVIRCTKNGWRMTDMPQALVNTIGEEILLWYE